jgi:hypothetical protein
VQCQRVQNLSSGYLYVKLKKPVQRGAGHLRLVSGTLLLLGFARLNIMSRIVCRIHVPNLPRASAV